VTAMGSNFAGMDGLRMDQAPPLSIPASFFLLAPLAMIASGALLAWGGAAVATTRMVPLALAATHLGTLGFLGAVMLGALYQMIPVVAGAPVPAVRLAHIVHILFATGVVALTTGFAIGSARWLLAAPLLLLAAIVLFLVPVAIAIVCAPTRSNTVRGMRLALCGLGAVATLGIVMALARIGVLAIHGDWTGWVSGHAALGALVWVGGLITAVSWQVVPMFYLTPPLPQWGSRLTLGTVALALLAVPCFVLTGHKAWAVLIAGSPAMVMVWWVHPLLVLRAIQQRRRKRADGSIRFWQGGMIAAPLLPVFVAGSLLSNHPGWSVALGWWAIWGWAGMVVHGMLTRIVPFLVWFHRYASLVGRIEVPTMRGLLPDKRIQTALAFHTSAVISGGVAILSGWEILARIAGLLLALAGVLLGINLVRTLAPRKSPQ